MLYSLLQSLFAWSHTRNVIVHLTLVLCHKCGISISSLPTMSMSSWQAMWWTILPKVCSLVIYFNSQRICRLEFRTCLTWLCLIGVFDLSKNYGKFKLYFASHMQVLISDLMCYKDLHYICIEPNMVGIIIMFTHNMPWCILFYVCHCLCFCDNLRMLSISGHIFVPLKILSLLLTILTFCSLIFDYHVNRICYLDPIMLLLVEAWKKPSLK